LHMRNLIYISEGEKAKRAFKGIVSQDGGWGKALEW
jgi:hypothetical protein